MCVPWELNPQPFTLLTQCSNHWATGTCEHHQLKVQACGEQQQGAGSREIDQADREPVYYHNSLKFIRGVGFFFFYHRFIQQHKRCPGAGHPTRVLKICVCVCTCLCNIVCPHKDRKTWRGKKIFRYLATFSVLLISLSRLTFYLKCYILDRLLIRVQSLQKLDQIPN